MMRRVEILVAVCPPVCTSTNFSELRSGICDMKNLVRVMVPPSNRLNVLYISPKSLKSNQTNLHISFEREPTPYITILLKTTKRAINHA